MGKKGTSISAPPVDPAVGIAMRKQAAIAERQQSWYENEMYPWLRRQTQIQNQFAQDDRDFAKDNAYFWRDMAQRQTDRLNQRADEYYNRWQQKFVPVENSLIADARRYNTSAEAERQASMGIADMSSAFRAQQQQQNMQLSAMGVAPTSGAFLGQQNAMAIQGAAMRAAAANQARQAAEALGWKKKTQMAALGQQYIGNSLNANQAAAGAAGTMGGLANNSIGQASGFGQLGTANITNMANVGLKSYQSMGNAWGQYGNLGMQKSNYNLSAWKTQQEIAAQDRQGMMGMIGTIVGAGAGMAMG